MIWLNATQRHNLVRDEPNDSVIAWSISVEAHADFDAPEGSPSSFPVGRMLADEIRRCRSQPLLSRPIGRCGDGQSADHTYRAWRHTARSRRGRDGDSFPRTRNVAICRIVGLCNVGVAVSGQRPLTLPAEVAH